MKTSNKLLIILACALIIIPILVIAVNVKLNYRKSDMRDSYLGTNLINNEEFNQQSTGRIAIPIAQPFTSVKLEDAMNLSVQIYVKKDARYGLKIQDFYKGELSTSINKDGELVIALNDKIKNSQRSKIILVVYCPTIKNIEVKNAFVTELAAAADTLNVNIENCRTTFFTGSFASTDDKTKITKTMDPTAISKLNLTLKNSEFNGYGAKINDLHVNAIKSKVNIGSDEKTKLTYYDNLSITANDASSIKIENLKAKTLKGDFSDDTQLQIPTSILKQMLK